MATAPPQIRPAIDRAAAKVRGLVRSEVQLFHRVAPVADSPAELWSVALFVFRHALTRVSRYRFFTGDQSLRVRGRTYAMGLVSGEVEIFPEIFRERIYDRREDFIPGPGWTVFDVGANVGLFSLLQAGRGAQVQAFEPNQDCFQRLHRNVAGNTYSGSVSVHKLALGREPGAATLHVPWAADHSGSLMGGPFPRRSREMAVAVTTLDIQVQQLDVSHIDLLKIDVEGWEIQVLEGASATLALTDRVIIEYHSQALRRQTSDLLHQRGLVPVSDLLCYPPDVGVIYARRAQPSR